MPLKHTYQANKRKEPGTGDRTSTHEIAKSTRKNKKNGLFFVSSLLIAIFAAAMAERKRFHRDAAGGDVCPDLFAGAGGISEGFMQAYTDEKYYDFLLASDRGHSLQVGKVCSL